jgi:hypothetical protein
MDLGCYPLHMLREFSGLMPRVLNASAKTRPKNIDVAMEVGLEMAGGVPARVKCSMAQGDRGELTIINPVAPHHGNQITLKTACQIPIVTDICRRQRHKTFICHYHSRPGP